MMAGDATFDGGPVVADAALEALLVDRGGVAIVATDRDGVVTHWNAAAAGLFGWERTDALGRHLVELLGPLPPPEAPGVPSGAGGHRFDTTLRRADGSSIVCHLIRLPLGDAEISVLGSVLVALDVTAERYAERTLAARTGVTAALAASRNLEEAAPRIVAAVCQNLGWSYGALWAVDQARGVVRLVGGWHEADRELDAFLEAGRDIAFARGIGVPGRVWATGQAHWIGDVRADGNLPRAAAAASAGLRAAVAFPVKLADEVLGVLEFFSQTLIGPDESLVQTMDVVGSQVGQFMERLEAERSLRSAEEDARRARDQLQAILEGVTEGITVMAPDGSLVYANQEAVRLIGASSVETLLAATSEEAAMRFEIEDEQGRPLPLSALPGRRALAGDRPEPMVVRFRARGGGEDRWSLIRAAPVLDERGAVQFAVNVFHDITDRKRAEEAQRFLAEAGPLLSAVVTDYEATLSRVAELAVPRLADWCAIALTSPDGSFRTIKLAHVDPEKVRWAEELEQRYPPDPDAPTGVPNVLRTGRPEIYSEITPEMIEAANLGEDRKRILDELRLTSIMIVPLIARRRVLGAITFVSAESGRRYGSDDLALAEDLASRAALAVHNAELYRERDHIARTLQRSLLPPELPVIPFVDLGATYRPAGEGNEVGGDFYDVFELPDSNWVALMGDVCGKGPEAAALTGLARHTIRAAATRESVPSRALEILNRALLEQRDDHVFCTVAYLRLHPGPDGVRLTVASGGHPLPLVLRADGTVHTAGRPGTLIGIFPDPELHDRVEDLGPGDTIVLFTDGVTEEHGDSELFGRDRLVDVLRRSAGLPAQAIAEAVERAVTGFRPEPLRDDLAVLVLKARPR